MNVQYLRPLKAEALQNLYNSYANFSNRLNCEELRNVQLKPIGVIDPTVLKNDHRKLIVDDLDLAAEVTPASSVENCTVLYGGYMHFQWGHFLTNTLSRLWPLASTKCPHFDKVVFFCNETQNPILKANFQLAMQLLGISDKVEILTSARSYSHVIVPDLSFGIEERYSDEFAAIFKMMHKANKEENNGVESSFKKVFLTRSALSNAKINEINIEMLDDFMRNNGFLVVYPEQLTLNEMLTLLGSAIEIASISGTTAHNVLLANEKAKVVIFERYTMNNLFQPGINLSMHLEAIHVDASVAPMLTSQGAGPYMYYPTPELLSFAEDNSLTPPNNKIKKAKILRRYMKTCFRHYDYRLVFEEWQMNELPAFIEAYNYALEEFRPWLTCKRPLLLFDRLNLRKLVKRLLRRWCLRNYREVML